MCACVCMCLRVCGGGYFDGLMSKEDLGKLPQKIIQ